MDLVQLTWNSPPLNVDYVFFHQNNFFKLDCTYCTVLAPNCNVICSMYIPYILLTDKFCLSEFQILGIREVQSSDQ